MSCDKKVRTYISRTVLVSGKKSFMHEHDFYEIGLLPIGGLTDEVLVKCSAVNYHTTWVDVNTLISIPPAIQARNGLTITSGFVELGGILIQDTAIDAAGFNLDITDITTFTTSGISLDVDFSSDITITGGSVILDSVLNDMSLITPLVTGATANIGDVLTLQSAAGVVEWAPNAAIPPQARNGLSVNGNFVEIGGPMIFNSSITVDSTSSLTIISTVTPTNYFFIDDNSIELSSSLSRISLGSIMNIRTPGWFTGPNTYTTVGKVLQNVNIITAEAEFSVFALPLTVGLLGQVLTSDGVGVVNWTTPTPPGVDTNIYNIDGTLLTDRIVTGDGKDLTFDGIDVLSTINTTTIDLNATTASLDATGTATISGATVNVTGVTTNNVSSATTTVTGTASLRLATPSVGAAAANHVLTLNNVNGDCEWKVLPTFPPAPTSYVVDVPFPAFTAGIPIAGWGEYILAGVTHGQGVNPIVQVYQDISFLGSYAQRAQAGEGAVNIRLVELNNAGDIKIHVDNLSSLYIRIVVKAL